MKEPIQEKLYTVKEAAHFLGLSKSTLDKWRVYGKGPVFIKMGRCVRYRQEDLHKYVAGKSVSSTSMYIDK